MFSFKKSHESHEKELYNKIILLSRNKLFYTKFKLSDTLENRIYLIFLHISFLFVIKEQTNNKKFYDKFFQNIFDLVFKNVELNFREIGYGDVTVNKNMKFLVKAFYDILSNCIKYKNKNDKQKDLFFNKYLKVDLEIKMGSNHVLIDYFNKYQAFCFDLDTDSVLKGVLNFNYK